MAIFSVEIRVAATVYVVAETEEEAINTVKEFDQTGGELPTGIEFIDGLPVSGARYNDPGFPDISISPAVTIYASGLTAYFVEESGFDCDRAFTEGWGIFQASGDGQWYIDSDDEAESKSFIGTALEYVEYRAQQGSEYHRDALEWVEEVNADSD